LSSCQFRVARGEAAALHTQFVRAILDVKTDDTVLDGGLVDIKKMNPLVFMPDSQAYYGIGAFMARAIAVGKAL
jgi:hypothetical protein